MAAAAAAAGGWSGVIPATVHVQVRRLQPLLPGARGRAAGRARHHRVLPGGVEVQVRQPPLHAMSAVRASRRPASHPASQPAKDRERRPRRAGPTLHYCTGRGGSRLRCAARARARCRGPLAARMGGICALQRRVASGDLPL
jgi:hypothetical protein